MDVLKKVQYVFQSLGKWIYQANVRRLLGSA